jgi:hypothetical protein
MYENPFCHHPSADGHQTVIRRSPKSTTKPWCLFGDFVLLWHSLILNLKDKSEVQRKLKYTFKKLAFLIVKL